MDYRDMRRLLRRMPRMEEALSGYREQRKNILAEIDLVENRVGAKSLTGMPRGSDISNMTEESAIKLISERYRERLAELTAKIQKLQIPINKVESAMKWITKQQTQILRLRYWEGKSMGEVAYEMKLDRRYCYKLETLAFTIMSEHM